jgi:hypothetical protein
MTLRSFMAAPALGRRVRVVVDFCRPLSPPGLLGRSGGGALPFELGQVVGAHDKSRPAAVVRGHVDRA